MPKLYFLKWSQSFSDLVLLSDPSFHIIDLCCFRASTYFLFIQLQLILAEAYNFSSDIRFTMIDSELAQTEPLKCHRLLLLLLGQKQMLFYSISAIVIAIFYHQKTDCLKSQCRKVKFGDAETSALLSPSIKLCLKPISLGSFDYTWQ